MTQEVLKEGLSLFGFELTVYKETVSFSHENVEVTINRNLTEEELKIMLSNIPNWYKIFNDSTD